MTTPPKTSAEQREGFHVEHVRLTADRASADAPPLRLVQLSDLHMRSWQPRHDAVIETINQAQADVVCVTGDMIGRTRSSWDLVKRLLTPLRARHGIYATRGNWEVDCGVGVAWLREFLGGCGVELLQNEGRTVRPEFGAVRLCGVDDLSLGWPSLEEALTNGDTADYTVVLSHAPLEARFVTDGMGVDLVLSGHTHAGQLRVPLLWRIAIPCCSGGYVAGLYRESWGNVYVSRGFGTGTFMTLRFRCPREITIIDVTPALQEAK